MRVKSGMMVLSLLFVCMFAHVAFVGPVSAATVDVQNASYYSSGTSLSLNEQIQSILDGASSGDTIKFLGNVYENLQLIINKKLNIVTNGTRISGSNSSGSAVFLINGSQASGTQIKGFTINTGSGSGVLVNNTRNVTLSNDQISSTNGSAVTANKSSSTVIKNSNITNSNTGITVSNSNNTKILGNRITNSTNGVTINNSVNTTINNTIVSNSKNNGIQVYNSSRTFINNSTVTTTATDRYEEGWGFEGQAPTMGDNQGNGIYVQNSDKTKIAGSNISENYRGISTKDVTNMTLVDNAITNCRWQGILLRGYARTVLIKNNIVENDNDGIVLDCSSKNITIRGNILTDNYIKARGCGNGHGLTYGSNYSGSETSIIEHNIITDNTYPYQDGGIGSNFYGTADYESYLRLLSIYGTNAVTTANTKLVLVRTGVNTYSAYFADGNTGQIETDFYPISLTFTTSTGYSVTVSLVNGVATVTIGGHEGTLTTSFEDVVTSLDLNSALSKLPASYVYSDTDWETELTSIPSSGSSNNPGKNGDINVGSSSGSNPVHGSSSYSNVGLVATTAAAGTVASADGQAGSNGKESSKSKDSKTTQEIVIDDVTNNPEVWGIIGIIVLVIFVLLAYYRKDLMSMIKKSKK
jgi:parallel beta-helix repeat protein